MLSRDLINGWIKYLRRTLLDYTGELRSFNYNECLRHAKFFLNLKLIFDFYFSVDLRVSSFSLILNLEHLMQILEIFQIEGASPPPSHNQAKTRTHLVRSQLKIVC